MAASFTTYGQVGIGTTTPEGALDIVSTNSGLILSRVANTAAVTAVNGMMIYDMSSTCVKAYENGAWTACLSAEALYALVDCDMNGFEGAYVVGLSSDASNDFTLTITNYSGTADFSFNTSDLTLSGSGIGSMSVSSVSPASASLTVGQSQVVTYQLTGTPAAGVLQADWSNNTLSCTITKTVANGDATFARASNISYIFSVNHNLLFDEQGTLTSGTTINLPYTNGYGTYPSYTSPFTAIDAQYAEDGASDWTFGYSYTGGTFSSSGDLVVTLITRKGGVETNFNAKRVSDITIVNYDFVNLPLVVDGVTKTNTIGLTEGGDAIRGSLSTSGPAYDLAATNEWVLITEAEYDYMTTFIPSSVKSGNTTTIDVESTIGWSANYTVTMNDSGTLVPASSYIYAFKVRTGTPSGSTGPATPAVGSQLKGNASAITGPYANIGTTLPSTPIVSDTVYAYVMRQPNAVTTISDTYIALYNATYKFLGNGTLTSGSAKYGGGNLTNITSNYGVENNMQVLSTNSKAW